MADASRITYYPAVLPGCEAMGAQATSSAGREWCALVTALACYRAAHSPTIESKTDGHIWGPDVRELEYRDAVAVGRMFAGNLGRCGVDWMVANFWTKCLLHEQFILDPVKTVVRTDGEAYTLDEYQLHTLTHTQIGGGILDLDTGLGKTLTAVCGALTVAREIPASTARCWILCPLSAIGAWDPYLEALRDVFDDVRVVSLDSTHKLMGDPTKGGVMILDEVHRFGVPKARRTAAALEIRKSFHSCFALTGTLLHSGVEKVLSIHDLALPGSAIFANRWKCGEQFQCIVKNKFGSDLAKPGQKARDAFFAYLSRHVVSLDKRDDDIRDQIGLGDIEQEVITVKIGEPWASMEETVAGAAMALWDEAQEEWAAALAADTLTEQEREDGPQFPHAAKTAHKVCRLGVEEKLDWLADNLDDDELPIVVFAQYTDTLQYLREALEESGLRVGYIDGATDKAARPLIEAAFQAGEIDVFLGQAQATSIALNLFRSCISIHFDHPWKADDYYQCLGRTYRRGQDRDCLHINLVSNPLQKKVVDRLDDAMDFDASCSTWQKVKTSINAARKSQGA